MLAVPTTKLPLCAALDQLGRITWREIEAGVACRQLLDEESITNYNLMRLATAVPSVYVEKHTKRREWKTGADWEWWIGRPGSFLGFRFQAKIINTEKGEYSSLFHGKSHALKQVDKLILSSESSIPRTYPVFCFYNYFDISLTPPKAIPCNLMSSGHDLVGWTTISAYVLRALLIASPTKKFQHLASHMYPIRCLHCCTQVLTPESMASGSRMATIAQARVVSLWHRGRFDSFPMPQIHERGPVYVERLFKGETAKQGWGGPFAFLFPAVRERRIPNGLSRVVIVRDSD